MKKIMHIRPFDEEYAKFGIREYDKGKRGITIVAEKSENGDFRVAWAIQNPRDQYSRKRGIEKATRRLNDGVMVMTIDADPGHTFKFNLLNEFASTCYKLSTVTADLDRETAEMILFVNMALDVMCDAAFSNLWFKEIREVDGRVPSIHPLVLTKYMERVEGERNRKEESFWKLMYE